MLSQAESDALRGIIPRQGTFPWDVRGITRFQFFENLFPEISINIDIFSGGLPDTPVFTPPVFESTGGPTVFVEPPGPSPPPDEPFPAVSIFSDIVSVFTGPSDVGSGGGGIFGDVLGDIILRQTTSAEERVLGGIGLPGDIAKAIGNIGVRALEGHVDLPFLQGLPTFATQPGVTTVADFFGNGIGVAPCPTPGGSSGFPAGSCITLGDWERMGSPKGFEAIGRSGGETMILRKKRRRRRRGGLTKGMMTDVDYLARKLGKPAAETYLNRVL